MCTPRRPSPPGSSCPGARRAQARESSPRPLLGLLLASPKLRCAPPAGPLQPEFTRPAVRGNFGFGRAAPRVPSGTGWGAARLPGRWRTTLRAGGVSGEGAGAGAGAGGAGAGEAVRAPARCPLCAAARRPSDIARVPPAPPRGPRGPPPPTNGRAALPHRPSEKGAGPGARGDRAGRPRTVQILIGNNAAVRARVGGLGRASDRVSPERRPSRLHPRHTPTLPIGSL